MFLTWTLEKARGFGACSFVLPGLFFLHVAYEQLWVFNLLSNTIGEIMLCFGLWTIWHVGWYWLGLEFDLFKIMVFNLKVILFYFIWFNLLLTHTGYSVSHTNSIQLAPRLRICCFLLAISYSRLNSFNQSALRLWIYKIAQNNFSN